MDMKKTKEYPILKNIAGSTPDIVISENKFTLGHSCKCNYVIPSVQISRKHCQFTEINGHWTITDLSCNGLLLSEKIIEKNVPTKIEHGNVITLCDNYKYVFHIPSNIAASGSTIQFAIDSNEETDGDNTNESGDASKEQKTVKPKTKNVKRKAVDDAVEDELHCTICTDLFIKAVTLNCSHTFCQFCISRWRKDHTNCPICRKKITSQSPTIVLDSFIARITATLSAEEKRKRKEALKLRKQQEESAAKQDTYSSGSDSEGSNFNYDDSDSDSSYDSDVENYINRCCDDCIQMFHSVLS